MSTAFRGHYLLMLALYSNMKYDHTLRLGKVTSGLAFGVSNPKPRCPPKENKPNQPIKKTPKSKKLFLCVFSVFDGFCEFFFIFCENFTVRSRRDGTASGKVESPSSFFFFVLFFFSFSSLVLTMKQMF